MVRITSSIVLAMMGRTSNPTVIIPASSETFMPKKIMMIKPNAP
jgi:hypothetical protein